MATPEFGKEEHAVVTAVTTQDSSGLDASSYARDLEIATYLKTNIKGGKILIDDFTGTQTQLLNLEAYGRQPFQQVNQVWVLH